MVAGSEDGNGVSGREVDGTSSLVRALTVPERLLEHNRAGLDDLRTVGSPAKVFGGVAKRISGYWSTYDLIAGPVFFTTVAISGGLVEMRLLHSAVSDTNGGGAMY